MVESQKDKTCCQLGLMLLQSSTAQFGYVSHSTTIQIKLDATSGLVCTSCFVSILSPYLPTIVIEGGPPGR